MRFIQVLLLSILLAGCSVFGTGDEGPPSYVGIWVHAFDDGELYLNITETTLRQYLVVGDACRSRTAKIDMYDEPVNVLYFEEGGSWHVEVEDKRMVAGSIVRPSDRRVYVWTDTVPGNLSACQVQDTLTQKKLMSQI